MDEVVKQANVLKTEGNKLLAEGHVSRAVAKYTEAIDLHPTAVFHANRAACYIKQEEYGQAASDGASAITLDPNYAKGYYRRGTAFIALGKYDEAHADFKEVARRFPKNEDARQQLKACTDKKNVAEGKNVLLTFLLCFLRHSGRLRIGLAGSGDAAHERRIEGLLETILDPERCTQLCHELQLLVLEILSSPTTQERENMACCKMAACSADSWAVSCMDDYQQLPYWFANIVGPNGVVPRLGGQDYIKCQQSLQYAPQILYARQNGYPRDASGRAADPGFQGAPQSLRNRSDGVDRWEQAEFRDHELVNPDGPVNGHGFIAAARRREGFLAAARGGEATLGHEDIESVFRAFPGFEFGTMWCFHLQAHAGRAGASWEKGAHIVNHRFTIVELLGYFYLIESACHHHGQPAAAERVGGPVTFAEILKSSSSTPSDRYCSVVCLEGNALPNFNLGNGVEGAMRASEVVRCAGNMHRFPGAEVELTYFVRKVLNSSEMHLK